MEIKANLTAKGAAGSESFIAAAADNAVSNEVDRFKEQANTRFRQLPIYQQVMTTISGLTSVTISTLVSTASLLGVSATLLIVITAIVSPQAPAPTPEAPVMAVEMPVAVPVTQPPIIVTPPVPEPPVAPEVPTIPDALPTDPILVEVIQGIINNPGASYAPAPVPPLSFHSSIVPVPEDGTTATALSNFISTYNCF